MGIMGEKEYRQAIERLIEISKEWELDPLESFERIAEILKDEHFGIEYCSLDNAGICAPSMRYLNQGETYAGTLIYDDDTMKLYYGSWGDWYENTEQEYNEENDCIRCGYCGEFTEFDPEIDDWQTHICHCGNCVSGG
jgi:hypothetical protein